MLNFNGVQDFLKGLPLLDWLDEHDPNGEWIIALAKRQAMVTQKLSEWQNDCEFHGERTVWLPNLHVSHLERDRYILKSGFLTLKHRSLECQPCTHSTIEDLEKMSLLDKTKLNNLENFLSIKMPFRLNSEHQIGMGCGDPFGCGL